MMLSNLVLIQIAFCAVTFATDYNIESTYVVPRVENIKPFADGVIKFLPENVKPSNYNINIKTGIDTGDDKFSGVVKIDITVSSPATTITLHSKQLTIDSAQLTTKVELPTVTPLTSTFEENDQFLILTSASEFSAGNYILEIAYNGILRTDNLGFYKSSYTNDDGTEVFLATTQFEAMEARHGFPCFDEPQLKATFDIIIEHGCKYHAISNSPVSSIV